MASLWTVYTSLHADAESGYLVAKHRDAHAATYVIPERTLLFAVEPPSDKRVESLADLSDGTRALAFNNVHAALMHSSRPKGASVLFVFSVSRDMSAHIKLEAGSTYQKSSPLDMKVTSNNAVLLIDANDAADVGRVARAELPAVGLNPGQYYPPGIFQRNNRAGRAPHDYYPFSSTVNAWQPARKHRLNMLTLLAGGLNDQLPEQSCMADFARLIDKSYVGGLHIDGTARELMFTPFAKKLMHWVKVGQGPLDAWDNLTERDLRQARTHAFIASMALNGYARSAGLLAWSMAAGLHPARRVFVMTDGNGGDKGRPLIEVRSPGERLGFTKQWAIGHCEAGAFICIDMQDEGEEASARRIFRLLACSAWGATSKATEAMQRCVNGALLQLSTKLLSHGDAIIVCGERCIKEEPGDTSRFFAAKTLETLLRVSRTRLEDAFGPLDSAQSDTPYSQLVHPHDDASGAVIFYRYTNHLEKRKRPDAPSEDCPPPKRQRLAADDDDDDDLDILRAKLDLERELAQQREAMHRAYTKRLRQFYEKELKIRQDDFEHWRRVALNGLNDSIVAEADETIRDLRRQVKDLQQKQELVHGAVALNALSEGQETPTPSLDRSQSEQSAVF